MKKKYAFIIMGNYDTKKDLAEFESEDMLTRISTVRDMDEAKDLVVSMKSEGFGAIETCGAFSEKDIDELIDLLDGEVGIARVIAGKNQAELMAEFFGN